MNVLADYHHGGLYGSLKRLFEDRLGWNLYRPIETDWFTEGWWKVAEPYGNPQETINQYLDTHNRSWGGFPNLNQDYKLEDNVYHIYDPENQIYHKAISFKVFKEMRFDLIVASHPLHASWIDLLKYQPKAKFIMQIGNEGQTATAKNIMSSVSQFQPQSGQNVFFYHQEFPTDHLGWEEPKNHNIITSFVHLLPHPEIYYQYKNLLEEFNFRSYGMQCPDGIPPSKEELGMKMKESAFGWHIKPADGYGHLIHQWYACGRPVITKGSYYEGKTGGMLLTDQETCIDLDKHSIKENCDLIRFWSQPENHTKMCLNAKKRFHYVVDFDAEAKQFKDWISLIV